MTGTIKIDTEYFLREATKLEAALSGFRGYVNGSTNEYLENLESFNSDFIESLKKVLRRINDDAGPELLAKIEEHQKLIATIASTFEEVDNEVASSYSGGN